MSSDTNSICLNVHPTYSTMIDLTNKVALLTGASSGIGLATTKLFLESGAKVYAVDIAPLKDQALVKASEDVKGNFAFQQIDLTRSSAADDTVKACLDRFGGSLNILGNIAGIADTFASAGEVKDESLENVLNINLKVPIQLMRAALPSMVKGKSGSIINVSSMAGSSGAVAGIAYTSSKHGLVSLRYNPNALNAGIDEFRLVLRRMSLGDIGLITYVVMR